MARSRSRGSALSRRSALLAPAALALAATDASSAAAEAPALTLEDRLALQGLLGDLLWALDCNDEDGFIGLFTPDLEVYGLGRLYDAEATVRAWFRGLISLRDEAGEAWLHEAGQFRFEGDGRVCVVYAYATHFRVNPQTRDMGVRSLGYFVNECVHAEGGWRFRRFSINRWDNERQPWRKPKPWEAIVGE